LLKKTKIFLVILIISFFGNKLNAKYEMLAYDFNFEDLEGNNLSLSNYKNKIIIVINVASNCGFTNQYEDMQKIWEKYKDKNLIVLGVPSNDFGKQEPGTNNEIKIFCESKFGVNFPMTSKISVKGEKIHPFYKWAKKNYGDSAVPKWNFHKIIINKEGKIETTFSSLTKPSSKRFHEAIEKLLIN